MICLCFALCGGSVVYADESPPSKSGQSVPNGAGLLHRAACLSVSRGGKEPLKTRGYAVPCRAVKSVARPRISVKPPFPNFC